MPFRVDRLRQTREKRGLTQRELARSCDIGENQINRYESGSGEPSIANLASIAHVLGVSTDYLLGLSELPAATTEEALKPEERKLINAYWNGDSATIMELVSARLRSLAKETDK